MLVLRLDRPRRIDRLIDYFGEQLAPALRPVDPRVGVTSWTRRDSRWGTGGGLGIVGTVLLIVVVLYLVGRLR